MRGLYAIVDVDFLGRRRVDPLRFAERVLQAGPAALQLRDKCGDAASTLRLLEQLASMCAEAAVPLFANDRADLAQLAGCYGVHLGREDPSAADVRRLSPALRIGVSTHTPNQVTEALGQPHDYIAYGPVFETRSKTKPDPVVGLEELAEVARRIGGTTPLVAIGGITLELVPSVARHAPAVAMISALLPEGASVAAAGEIAAEVQRAFEA